MNRVKELRIASKLSQKALADLIGVHQTAVSQWETGRTDPDKTQSVKLAEFFDVSIDWVLGHDKVYSDLDDIYLDLARGARDRKLQLSKNDVDFLLDFAESLKKRDSSK